MEAGQPEEEDQPDPADEGKDTEGVPEAPSPGESDSESSSTESSSTESEKALRSGLVRAPLDEQELKKRLLEMADGRWVLPMCA